MGSSRVIGYAIMAIVTLAFRYPLMFLLAVVCLPTVFGGLHWLNSYSPEPQTGVNIQVVQVDGNRPDFWKAHDGSSGDPSVIVTITNTRTSPLPIQRLICTLEGPVSHHGILVGVHKVIAEVGADEHTLAPGARETLRFDSTPSGQTIVGTEHGTCDWTSQRWTSGTETTWLSRTPAGENFTDVEIYHDL